MKRKNGFTSVGAFIAIGIIGFHLALIVDTFTRIKRMKQEFGRDINRPTIGQTYLVTACDKSVGFMPIGPLVIAMPYNTPGDKEPSITDRRVLLKVNDYRLCKPGVWFVGGVGGEGNIIPSPLGGTTNALESSFF
jgi:hypothetical protein